MTGRAAPPRATSPAGAERRRADRRAADPLTALRAAAAERASVGMRRAMRPRPAEEAVLDLASNDYLGLARDPRVVAGAVAALQRWGAGATGSRLVTGSTQLHIQLEAALASFVGCRAALAFSSGYLANLGAVAALAGPGTLVVSDALNHASIVDACRLCRADVVVVPHRDVGAVHTALRDRWSEWAVVVTDAVFSVDGDVAPLADLHALARRYGALLIVDEAHALGVLGEGGRGAAAAAGLAGAPDAILTLTLSKALGGQGGAVLADPVVIEHCVNTARTFIFDTGLAPASAGAALTALRVLEEDPELPTSARRRARELAAAAADAGWTVTSPAGAVASVLVGPPASAVQAAKHLLEAGVRVGCFRPPSVPDGVSRLRLTARADLTDGDVERAGTALRRARRLVAPG